MIIKHSKNHAGGNGRGRVSGHILTEWQERLAFNGDGTPVRAPLTDDELRTREIARLRMAFDRAHGVEVVVRHNRKRIWEGAGEGVRRFPSPETVVIGTLSFENLAKAMCETAQIPVAAPKIEKLTVPHVVCEPEPVAAGLDWGFTSLVKVLRNMRRSNYSEPYVPVTLMDRNENRMTVHLSL